MINGNNICDCAWQGVCVYSEVQHNKKQITIARENNVTPQYVSKTLKIILKFSLKNFGYP